MIHLNFKDNLVETIIKSKIYWYFVTNKMLIY